MMLDVEKYRSHVDQFDMPEERKIALMESVWRIMERFVNLAYGLENDQLQSQQAYILQAQEAGLDSKETNISNVFRQAVHAAEVREDHEKD